LVQQRDEGELIEQIPLAQLDPILQVGDPLELIAGRATDHAHDLVALLEKEFRQVGPVLPRDAGDERTSLGHNGDSSRACPNSVILFALCLLETIAMDAWSWHLRPEPWRGHGEAEVPPPDAGEPPRKASATRIPRRNEYLDGAPVSENSQGGKCATSFAHSHATRVSASAERGLT